jgi:hypothetical protein
MAVETMNHQISNRLLRTVQSQRHASFNKSMNDDIDAADIDAADIDAAVSSISLY